MSLWIWGGFLAFVLALVALDLGVFHRKARVMKISEALAWTAAWIVLGLTILAVEFVWARRWLKWIKETSDDVRKSVSNWLHPKNPRRHRD